MSAIGSVIVMGGRAFLPAVPGSGPPGRAYGKEGWLPAALGDAGQLAGVRHLTHADAAETERAEDRPRTAAPVAARVAAHGELRLAVGLLDQGLLGHLSS